MEQTIFCPHCEEEREFITKKEKETYFVKREPIEIVADVTYCKHCSEQIWNREIDDANLVRAYAKYRSTHGLLQPERIKEIREKYSLTQVAFAKLLGFGEKTIARYETGSIQDEAHNILMELANFPDVFEYLLEKNKKLITDADYTKALETLRKFKPCFTKNGKTILYQPKHKKDYHFRHQNGFFGGLCNEQIAN